MASRRNLRAKDAGFDIIYVYKNHMALAQHFLLPKINDRMDEYGGPLENRARLIRELIEDTKKLSGTAVQWHFGLQSMKCRGLTVCKQPKRGALLWKYWLNYPIYGMNV